MTTVIHVKDAPLGWKRNAQYLYCGRGSKWGNPFPITQNQDRERVCDLHQQWFETGDLSAMQFSQEVHPAYAHRLPPLVVELRELRDKVLVCFCNPERCHCHYLAMRVNTLDAVCVICKKNSVNVHEGYDTCQECLSKA